MRSWIFSYPRQSHRLPRRHIQRATNRWLLGANAFSGEHAGAEFEALGGFPADPKLHLPSQTRRMHDGLAAPQKLMRGLRLEPTGGSGGDFVRGCPFWLLRGRLIRRNAAS
jgi:hypothetical protein